MACSAVASGEAGPAAAAPLLGPPVDPACGTSGSARSWSPGRTPAGRSGRTGSGRCSAGPTGSQAARRLLGDQAAHPPGLVGDGAARSSDRVARSRRTAGPRPRSAAPARPRRVSASTPWVSCRSPAAPARPAPRHPRTARGPHGARRRQRVAVRHVDRQFRVGTAGHQHMRPPARPAVGSRLATLGNPGGRRSSSRPSTTSSRCRPSLGGPFGRLAPTAHGTGPGPRRGGSSSHRYASWGTTAARNRLLSASASDGTGSRRPHPPRRAAPRSPPRTATTSCPRTPHRPATGTRRDRWRTRRSRPVPAPAEQLRHAPVQGPADSRTVAQYGGLRPLWASRQPQQSARPVTPSRAHQSDGFATPGPHPGWAGSCSSAVSGDGRDRRRPLPRRVLSDHPEQPAGRHHRGAGHPRPLRLRQAACLGRQRSRGDADTCTLNSPAASFDSTGTTPIASTVSRTVVGDAGLGEPRVADRVAALHRLTRRTVPIHLRPARSAAGRPAGSSISTSARSGPGPFGIPDEARVHASPSTRSCAGRGPGPAAPPRPRGRPSAPSVPTTMQPDPYRYRAAAASPWSAITSTNRAANGTGRHRATP